MRAGGFLSTLLLASLVAAAPASPAAKRQCSAPVPSTTVAPPSTTPIPPPETSTPVPTDTTSDPSTPPTETEAPPTATETEAPPTSTPPPAGGGGGGSGPALRKHALVGYLHSSFMNGAGYIRMKDVGDEWDIINLSFGEPDTPTSGNIKFSLCPVEECPDVESEAEFIAAVDEKVAQGKLVQLSIGGEKGQVRLETEAARDKFVETISAICEKYHLTGLDIDFEGQSLSLDAGDSDFTAPTTPVIVNLISAMKTLKAKFPHFSLTMAPETFFVQLGVTFYGSGEFGGQDARAGAYLPVIHALRDDLTMLHVQNYNSGPITGLDGKAWTMGSADFHVAMTDVVLQGFNVAGKEGASFPPLRPDQVGFGVPSSMGAGNGFVEPPVVQAAAECLMKGTNCGEYKPAKAYPDLRGVMTWSINWDHFFNGTFASSMRPFLDAL